MLALPFAACGDDDNGDAVDAGDEPDAACLGHFCPDPDGEDPIGWDERGRNPP